MPDIRYVCLSDMHLGADNSILTRIQPGSIEVDPLTPGPVLHQLVACLRDLIERNESAQKPTLVLNGDILEMALSDTNKAAMVFERFIELVFPKDGQALFDKHILYIPGNHDHHIWESARETQYINFVSTIQPGGVLEAPWHTTKMVAPDAVRESFLTNLLQRFPHLQDAVVQVIYPSYALFDTQEEKCIIFSHGHYIEPIYSLMSTLNTMIFPLRKRPSVMWELEAENFAWVDFFWSTMGRSGGVGQDIGLFYNKMQDRQQLEKLLANFITSLIEQSKRPGWVEGIEIAALELTMKIILAHLAFFESKQPERSLSENGQQGLKFFIEGPLRDQFLVEHQQSIPQDITFIFGHTHKPFQQLMNFEGYPAPLNVYNSGGWVVDKLQVHPAYGASIILIDETLHPLAVRMYNQALSQQDYAVEVVESRRPGKPPSAFYTRLYGLIQPDHEPWQGFSRAVAEAVPLYERVLETKINL